MRDIGRRIQRYRLSRYAPPLGPVRRRLKWLWLLAAGWLTWIGVVSDHSLLQIWRLSREHRRMERDLDASRLERRKLESELEDRRTQQERAEHVLRTEFGMAGRGEIIYQFRDVPADSLGR
jgi:cell division protein FtsB